MTGEAGSMTISSAPNGVEAAAGLIYSQYYNLVKAPFDAQKTYALQPPVYENLALDPQYLRQLRHTAGVNGPLQQARIKAAYIRSKTRAAVNIEDCASRSFGIREEHRITLNLFRKVFDCWHDVCFPGDHDEVYRTAGGNWQGSPSPPLALPWVACSTKDVMDFLAAQINRHCLLFEYILGHTGVMFSLGETVAMIVALRSLRYCYSSNLLQREPLLFSSEWAQYEQEPPEDARQDTGQTALENVSRRRGYQRTRKRRMALSEEAPHGFHKQERIGLGMYESMCKYGFGWWRPGLFRWHFWRFSDDVTRQLLVGNLLVHAEYRRRWRAVRELRDVQVLLFQTQQWFSEHAIYAQPPVCKQLWLDYLSCIVLRQFDLDVWAKLHDENKTFEELGVGALRDYQRESPPSFCWSAMKHLFFDRGSEDRVPLPPHIVVGNKMAHTNPEALILYLFDWRDRRKRAGWSAMKYRTAAQRAHSIICRCLGDERADLWFNDLCRLVLLTHWILPYPNESAFFSTTKNNKNRDQYRRTMWFSTVLMPQSVAKNHSATELDIDNAVVHLETEAQVQQRVHGRARQTPRRQQIAHQRLPIVIVQKNLVEKIWKAVWEHNPLAPQLFMETRQIYDLLWETKELGKSDGYAWCAGRVRQEESLTGSFVPVVERKMPPKLAIQEEVTCQGKSLDELDEWFRNSINNLRN